MNTHTVGRQKPSGIGRLWRRPQRGQRHAYPQKWRKDWVSVWVFVAGLALFSGLSVLAWVSLFSPVTEFSRSSTLDTTGWPAWLQPDANMEELRARINNLRIEHDELKESLTQEESTR